METLGFIGLGRMGSRMAGRLLQAGYSLVVFDASAPALEQMVKAGAKAADSPADVASQAEIVLASLPVPPVVESVALGKDGIIHGSRIKVFVDMSTTGSIFAKRIAKGLTTQNIVAVDAPVSGGIAGAAKGTIAIMTSCSAEVFERLQPILAVMGKPFLVGSEPGQGQTMKLLNNLLSAAAMAISCEAVAMGVKAGLDPNQMVDVLNSGSGRNSATQDKMKQFVISRTFALGFSIELLNKDVRLCLEEAEALGVPMIVGSAVRQIVGITASLEGPEGDMTAIAKPVEKWAGVTIKAKE
jgi:3-hydroxyisobutyrate dehydrogenase-like beta-hydroxyacid dehydrogenase